jgi:hypothetical protein
VRVRVESYSGYQADERPVRFWLRERKLEVVSIERRWYEPGWSCFRVVADDAKSYLLRRSEHGQGWELM